MAGIFYIFININVLVYVSKFIQVYAICCMLALNFENVRILVPATFMNYI